MSYFDYLKQAKVINRNEQVNRLILVHLINKELSWLYANLNIAPKNDFLRSYLVLVTKYVNGYPLGYILGYVNFMGHKIIVDSRVLIPRDETAGLVEQVFLLSRDLSNDNLNILDLATGSGCIGVSVALKNLQWSVTLSDISSSALKVAKSNIASYNLSSKVKVIESDLFSNLTNQKFDIIISNPPYIDKSSNTYDSSLSYEPDLALFAKNNGLFFYQQIFAQVLDYVNKNFLLALEFGFDQKEQLEDLVKATFSSSTFKYWFVKDLNNHWRYLFIKQLL